MSIEELLMSSGSKEIISAKNLFISNLCLGNWYVLRFLRFFQGKQLNLNISLRHFFCVLKSLVSLAFSFFVWVRVVIAGKEENSHEEFIFCSEI